MTVPMADTAINDRWHLRLPPHRATWTEWPTWEKERLDAMHTVITAMVAEAPEIVEGTGRRLGPVYRPLVYDIGAEEGDMPALWSQWGADVALFEPDPRVWPNIKAVFNANGLRDPKWCFAGFASPVTILDAADGRMSTPDDVWPACATGPVIDDHGFCNVNERPDLPHIRIDDVAARIGRPDVITMDVEGAELEVMRSARDTLIHHRPVLLVSVHPQFMIDSYRQTAADLHEFMASFGYLRHLLAVDHEEHFVYQHPTNMWWR